MIFKNIAFLRSLNNYLHVDQCFKCWLIFKKYHLFNYITYLGSMNLAFKETRNQTPKSNLMFWLNLKLQIIIILPKLKIKGYWMGIVEVRGCLFVQWVLYLYFCFLMVNLKVKNRRVEYFLITCPSPKVITIRPIKEKWRYTLY